MVWSWLMAPAIALTPVPAQCPQALDPLVEQLLGDLPSYGNRVIQRTAIDGKADRYIVIAGRPEFEPLPLRQQQHSPALGETQQVFFTTLERHYSPQGLTMDQGFYWLFLAKDDGGWRFLRLFTRFDDTAPVTDVSRGALGQAIAQWFTDCQAR